MTEWFCQMCSVSASVRDEQCVQTQEGKLRRVSPDRSPSGWDQVPSVAKEILPDRNWLVVDEICQKGIRSSSTDLQNGLKLSYGFFNAMLIQHYKQLLCLALKVVALFI